MDAALLKVKGLIDDFKSNLSIRTLQDRIELADNVLSIRSNNLNSFVKYKNDSDEIISLKRTSWLMFIAQNYGHSGMLKTISTLK